MNSGDMRDADRTDMGLNQRWGNWMKQAVDLPEGQLGKRQSTQREESASLHHRGAPLPIYNRYLEITLFSLLNGNAYFKKKSDPLIWNLI